MGGFGLVSRMSRCHSSHVTLNRVVERPPSNSLGAGSKAPRPRLASSTKICCCQCCVVECCTLRLPKADGESLAPLGWSGLYRRTDVRHHVRVGHCAMCYLSFAPNIEICAIVQIWVIIREVSFCI